VPDGEHRRIRTPERQKGEQPVKLSHFEHFAPVCPACLSRGERASLSVAMRAVFDSRSITQGLLRCSSRECQREYPIIDGVPVLVADVRDTISKNHSAFARRSDLPPEIDGVLAEAAGPGSWDLTNLQHLSGAVWDHFGEFDQGATADDGESTPGAIARIVETARRAGGLPRAGDVLDVGCGVGRSTLEIASSLESGLVLGIDMHVASLRFSQGLIRAPGVSYQKRSMGMLYETRRFDIPERLCESSARADFWMMDALAPCVGRTAVPGSGFAGVTAFNVLDCVASPLGFLHRASEMLSGGGVLTISTPFDWSSGVTPIEAWIGGHSPRGFEEGRSDELLVRLLTRGAHPASVPGFRVIADLRRVPWHVRVHARSVMHYTMQLVSAVCD